MSDTSPRVRSWIVQVDRRQEHAHHEVLTFLKTLLPGIAQLDYTLFTLEEALRTPDEGALRDFIPVASFRHEDARLFQYIGEELIAQFGWIVDLSEVTQRGAERAGRPENTGA